MKLAKYFVLSAAALSLLAGCKDDPELQTTDIGPEMTGVVVDGEAVYGGQVSFAATLNDPLPLSTLKAQVLFDGDLVAEEVIRTKTNGTYEGTVTLPYYKNFPDGGEAELVIVAQNTHFGLTRQTFPLTVYYPRPEKIVYVLDGQEYDMTPADNAFEYAVTAEFPQKPKGYIRAEVDDLGSEVTFGYDTTAGGIVAGSTDAIPFTNSTAGEYTISFNIRTFDGAPFTKLLFDGVEMTMVDGDTYCVVATLEQDAVYTLEGIAGFDSWTLDSDFLGRGTAAEEVKFLPLGGLYKITADFKSSYLKAEAMKSATELATLNEDGTGAIWAIGGMEVGKPTLKNAANWNPEQGGMCLARVADKKYQITFVAGVSIDAAKFDFKFFHQKSWGGEFGGSDISTASDLVVINSDSGNLGLAEGKALDLGGIYRFTVDIAGGNNAAVLTVEKVGEQELPAADIRIDGVAMTQIDADNYSLDLDLTQGQTLTLGGADAFTPAWIDPNYFAVGADGGVSFIPVSGRYRIAVSLATRFITCKRVAADGSDATTAEDGTGGLWIMAWGVGAPSLDYQFGWDPGKAYCMAEYEPAKYRLTGTAGPETGSVIGDCFRTDYISAKYFFQNGWGGEMSGPTVEGGLLKDGGNLELADGVELEQGATYCLTVDLSAGRDSGVVSFVKK